MSSVLIVGAGEIGTAVAEHYSSRSVVVSARSILESQGRSLSSLPSQNFGAVVFAQGENVNQPLNARSLREIYISRFKSMRIVSERVNADSYTLISSSIANMDEAWPSIDKMPRASLAVLRMQKSYEDCFLKLFPRSASRTLRLGTYTEKGSKFNLAVRRARATLLFKRIRVSTSIMLATTSYHSLKRALNGKASAIDRVEFGRFLDETYGCTGSFEVSIETYSKILEMRNFRSLFLWEGANCSSRIVADP